MCVCVRGVTCGCGGAGWEHRQEPLPLQVEEMLLLHLEELLLDGDLLRRQLEPTDTTRSVTLFYSLSLHES